jgi:hypothetical protein
MRDWKRGEGVPLWEWCALVVIGMNVVFIAVWLLGGS